MRFRPAHDPAMVSGMDDPISDLKVFSARSFRLDGGAIFGVVPRALWLRLHDADDDNRITLTTRNVIFSSGDRTFLIDPGIGDIWTPELLERYGIGADESGLSDEMCNRVTDILLTHLHFDHVGGCFKHDADGQIQPRFPNARYHVQTGQWEWANAPSLKDRGSYIREHLQALEDSGNLQLHTGDWHPCPGVLAFAVQGHTRDQQLFRIETATGVHVYGGDLFALEAHLRLPWIMAYDIEPLETLREKQRVMTEHLGNGEFLILGHDPHVIGGRLDTTGKYPKLTTQEA